MGVRVTSCQCHTTRIVEDAVIRRIGKGSKGSDEDESFKIMRKIKKKKKKKKTKDINSERKEEQNPPVCSHHSPMMAKNKDSLN